MKITITLLLTGCATRCDFCHSGGGAGPMMPPDNFKAAITKLAEVIPFLEANGHDVALGLMHEPALHPQFVELMRYAMQMVPDYLDWTNFEWATSGIPFAVRPDWEDLFASLRLLHVEELCFTIAGTKRIHDTLVHRPGAWDHQQVAMSRAQQAGFSTAVRVLVSTTMLAECQDTLHAVKQMGVSRIEARVSEYAPVPRLQAFESSRPIVSDVLPYQDQLIACSPTPRYWRHIDTSTESSLCEQIRSNPSKYDSFEALEQQFPAWLFVDILPNLQIYRGLYGAYTHCLGHLAQHSAEQIAHALDASSPNYEFAAFFDVAQLPSPHDIADRFGDMQSDKLYRTPTNALLRWLDTAVEAGAVSCSTVRKFEGVPTYG